MGNTTLFTDDTYEKQSCSWHKGTETKTLGGNTTRSNWQETSSSKIL